MTIEDLIRDWFRLWESGNFEELPIRYDFRHTSPFGTIEGKEAYLALVRANRDKFLGYSFVIQDTIVVGSKACVRYTGIQDDFSLEVSEWFYTEEGLIREILAYYHIGEIRDERKLENT